MPEQSETSAPAAASTPRVYCKGCGYALVGLSSSTCPECGRGFDLSNRRTFARRPPRGWVWRWGRRVLGVVLLLILAAGAGVGWLWWGWQGEQRTIARLRVLRQDFTVRSIGPQRLRSVLGDRLGYLTDRVDSVSVWPLKAAETQSLDFGSLAHIQKLQLARCELINSHLSELGGLKELQTLYLLDLKIEKPDLAFLDNLPALSRLELSGGWVAEAGFEHLAQLKHLKRLDIVGASMKGADLQYLRGLSSLEELNLSGNSIHDAGLEHLQGLSSLRELWINNTLLGSPGLTKLKQAIPRLKVNEH